MIFYLCVISSIPEIIMPILSTYLSPYARKALISAWFLSRNWFSGPSHCASYWKVKRRSTCGSKLPIDIKGEYFIWIVTHICLGLFGIQTIIFLRRYTPYGHILSFAHGTGSLDRGKVWLLFEFLWSLHWHKWQWKFFLATKGAFIVV